MAILAGFYSVPVRMQDDETGIMCNFKSMLSEAGRRLVRIRNFSFKPYDKYHCRMGECQIQYDFLRGREPLQQIVGF